MIFKRGSRVIRVIDRANDRPLILFWILRGQLGFHIVARFFARAQWDGACTTLRPRAFTMRLVPADARSLPGMRSRKRALAEKESKKKRERERESGRNEKEEKERYLIDEVRRTRKKKKKKESLRPAQLRIRTSPSILITGHGRKEFVKILNVRAFFRADN